MQRQLNDVRKLIAGSTGESNEKAEAIETQLFAMLDEHKHLLLEVGAAGRLLISGELEDVLPLEDAKVLEEAKPITPSGTVKLDPVKVEVRHVAQVRLAFKTESVAVVILGRVYDLTAGATRFTLVGCECIRVTTRQFKDLSGRRVVRFAHAFLGAGEGRRGRRMSPGRLDV